MECSSRNEEHGLGWPRERDVLGKRICSGEEQVGLQFMGSCSWSEMPPVWDGAKEPLAPLWLRDMLETRGSKWGFELDAGSLWQELLLEHRVPRRRIAAS